MSAPKRELPDPVTWDQLYESRFVKGSECHKNPVFTIARVRSELLTAMDGGNDDDEDGGGKKEVTTQKKGILRFKEGDKELVVNVTRGLCLREMFGKQLANWIGKRVALAPDRHKGDLEGSVAIFGSPDIAEDLTVRVQLPRRSPRTYRLRAMADTKPAPAPSLPRLPLCNVEELLSKYETCDAAELALLEEKRKGAWVALSKADKARLKPAADAAIARINAATAPAEREPGADDT